MKCMFGYTEREGEKGTQAEQCEHLYSLSSLEMEASLPVPGLPVKEKAKKGEEGREERAEGTLEEKRRRVRDKQSNFSINSVK